MSRILHVALFAALVSIAGSAFADVVSLKIGAQNDPLYGDDVTVTPVGGSAVPTKAGPYPYSITNYVADETVSGHPLIPDGPYNGFCIALTKEIGYGSTNNFTVTSLSGCSYFNPSR